MEEEGDNDAEGDDSDSTVGGERGQQEHLSPGDPENLETMLLSRATVQGDSMNSAPIDPNLTLFDENGE